MLALQINQQIDHLGLDRYVERRYRLVADDKARPERQRPRDADALALAAGELVRIVQHLIRPEPDLLEQFGAPFPLFVTRGHAMDGEDLAAKDAASHRIVLHQIRYLEQSAGVGHGGPAISAARQHAAKWFSPQACNGGYSS